MFAIYERLLRLYPRAHRHDFAEEMVSVFDDLHSDVATKGSLVRFRFYVRESTGLLFGALRERWRESGLWRFSMQGEFRFPKATWILMTIILAGVFSAIEKGESISASFSRLNPNAAPIYQVGQHTLVSGIAISFACIYALGLLVWGVLLVLRRSVRNDFEGQMERGR